MSVDGVEGIDDCGGCVDISAEHMNGEECVDVTVKRSFCYAPTDAPTHTYAHTRTFGPLVAGQKLEKLEVSI